MTDLSSSQRSSSSTVRSKSAHHHYVNKGEDCLESGAFPCGILDFSSRFSDIDIDAAMTFADELFQNGQIRPLLAPLTLTRADVGIPAPKAPANKSIELSASLLTSPAIEFGLARRTTLGQLLHDIETARKTKNGVKEAIGAAIRISFTTHPKALEYSERER